jgi:hypothetical protein
VYLAAQKKGNTLNSLWTLKKGFFHIDDRLLNFGAFLDRCFQTLLITTLYILCVNLYERTYFLGDFGGHWGCFFFSEQRGMCETCYGRDGLTVAKEKKRTERFFIVASLFINIFSRNFQVMKRASKDK